VEVSHQPRQLASGFGDPTFDFHVLDLSGHAVFLDGSFWFSAFGVGIRLARSFVSEPKEFYGYPALLRGFNWGDTLI
jgi:hypothetical protein